ncbi:MobF family relaxase [Nostoc sp. FACHB-133]|uniref:MobF family relaxase n=1 Tax=Nostoc sp. FACHB-133 TaxID=2692835 RepID=UPI001F555774|nr:MobF family relaxase [Nostoc sp. FACHB-133]
MLTAANVSSEMAVNYFIKNYYHQGKSRWSGEGAVKLGLSGAVENQQAFKNVIEGRSPNGHEQLNTRVLKPDERRAALDCTFSAPKSVSLMALVGGDERLIAAHHQALKKVLTLMEQRYAITRVTQGDSRYRVNTANLVVAEFDHIESRSLDPHLHSHCLVMNTTEASGKWMSLINSEIFANKKFLGMAYQSYLATEVIKLGYEVEPRQHGQFEIKGFKEQDLEAFSKRRQQIIGTGASTTWAEREKIWDTTRQRKQKVTESELKSLWHEEAAALGISFVQPSEPNSFVQDSFSQQTLEDALDNAIAHCSERNVAFKQEDLEKFILRERLFTDVTAIEPLIKQHQELIALPGMQLQYTTWAAVKRELATIELMQSGQSKVNPICSKEVIERQLEKTSLNLGQRQAVSLAATTTDQFIAWQGVAGAGKTFALKELNAIALAQGYTVKGFAPSSMAAKVLSEELGIHSETVASLLVGEPAQVVEANQIWIVDEAGLLSAKDAHALLERATLLGARLLLVGDTKQLSAVEAGNPFKSLQQAGIQTAHLTQSNRQRNPELKIAVDLLADGRVEAGFKQLETIGSILEVSPDTKLETIAADYIALAKEQRARTLVLAGTNVEKLALTQAIRGKLKEEGSLGATANISQLQAKNLTLVQMRYTHNFELGDVVMPTRNYKRRGLEKGQIYEVVSKDLDRLTLRTSAGTHLEVDTNFDKAVYQCDEIEIAVGDCLQWKKNDRQLQRRNGQEFIVTAIEGDSAQIEYKDTKITETINLKLAQNLDYALVSTIYSSQGKTTDLALIAADYTIGQESFYVAISRARHNVKLYTKDKSELLELAHSSKAKDNALELLMNSLKVELQQKSQSEAITASVSPRANQPIVKLEVAIAEPVLKAQPPITEQVSLSVSQPVSRTAPLVTTSLETVAKPTLKEKHRDDRKSPVFEKPVLKTAVPTEPFWTPNQTEKIPNFIEPKHWQEFESSAIHPNITALNFESLQFNYTGGEHEAWERLMVSEKLNRTNTGRLTDGFIRAYSHLDAGGWWCDAGVDARTFADLKPGEKPPIKRWGCYKPNQPRPKKDESGQIIEGKFIKYEHPPKVDLSIFLLNVPDQIAERIYSKHKINPSVSDRQSGFWYCVWKHNIPCAIAEGAKKAASLLSQGHAAIGLPGISAGYRTPKDEFGKKIGKSYLHEELAVFATPSREIKFCFDYETKPETKLNIERDISVTGRLLQKAGARVKVVSLPGPSKGVDDFIVASGPLAYEKLSHQAMKLRDWQQHNQHSKVAAIEPLKLQFKESSLQQTSPNQPIGQTHDNQQQPNPDTVLNREDRGIINLSRETEQEFRAVRNQKLSTHRENSELRGSPATEVERVLTAVSRDIECQEIEQLGAISARINPSSTDGRLRGQRAANFSRQVNPEDSAIIDGAASDVSFEQNGNAKRPTTEQLLNAITENIQQSVVDDALVETLPQLTEQLYGYQQHFLGARTRLDDFGAVIASIEQQISSKRTVDVISDFIEQSVVESTLITLLPELLEQLSQGSQQLAHRTAIAQQSELSSSQKTVWAIAENIEQSLVESTLSIALPLLIKQLSPLRQQQKGVRSRFDDLEAVITQIEQRLSSQRVIDAITQNVEYSAVSSALTVTLPQLIKQFSPLRQQLKKGIATFDKIFTAIEPLSQRLDLQKTIDIIAEDIEQLAVESALSETLPQLIDQLSQHHQHISGRITKFDDLETAISQFEQHLSTKKTVLSVVENIEQSLVESALAETLPRLIEQLSKTCQQQKALKPAFDKISTRIEHEIQYLSSQRAVDVIAQNIEQSLVESIITETLPQLIKQLSQTCQQLKGRTTFDGLGVAITQIQQRLDSQKTVDTIIENIEDSAVESALTGTLPQLIKQFSQTCQQLKGTRTKFENLETAITQFEQRLDSQRIIDPILENIEDSAVESALTETLPQLIKQFSQYHQQLKGGKTRFHGLEAAITQIEQQLSSQRTILSIAQSIEQSLVESIITETLPQLIKQLSQFSQQLKGGKTTFNQFQQLLDNELIGYLTQKTRTSEHLVLNAISDYVAQETVASYETVSALSKLKELLGMSQSQTLTEFTTALQKVLELIENLEDHQNHEEENVQPLSLRLTTNIEVETELSKESVKLHLKKMIQGLAREQLAEVVMEVGKYVKGEKVTEKKVSELFTSVTTDAKALSFEQKMNIVRQLIKDDKPSIMKRLGINSPSPDDNEEHLRFRR